MSASVMPHGTPHAAATTDGCRYCWMCRQACPVGHVTARETLTPHAWALTIESVARGQLSWNPETVDVLYACADCGLCQAHCATDQPLPDAIVAARSGVAASRHASPVVYELEQKLRAHANPHVAVSPTASSSTGATALFVGDAGAHLGSAEIVAATRLLLAAGQDVVAIGSGRSSGLLANALGLRPTAIELATAVLAELAASGARNLLVLGAGDQWTFEHVYPTRLGLAWPAGVAIRDVADVLSEALTAGRLHLRANDAGPYAYIDPCHTARVGRTRPAPRALLASAFGAANARELFWREHRAHPCGAAGGLEFTQPTIAAQLTDARLDDAVAVGATWVVTDDPSCAHQLRSRAGDRLPVRGLYETLAAQL